MVNLINCSNKKRLKNIFNNPCTDCDKRWKGCRRKHELIDSNIILNKYLDGVDVDKWDTFLKLNGVKYTGYITTIQIGHIIRAFSKKLRKLKIEGESKNQIEINKIEQNLKECISELTKFHVLDFEGVAESIYNDLKNKEGLRMESHDKMNVAIAIKNKLFLQVIDNDLQDDFPTIQEISKEFGFNIKFNQDYS